MGDEHALAFGGGATQTTLSPIVLVAMLIAILLILVLPRKYVIVPLLMSLILVPEGEQLYAFGVHWLVCRIIILFALLRVVIIALSNKSKLVSHGFNSVDRAFLGCVICEAIAVVLLFMQSQAVVNQVGFLIDFVGGYLVLRVLIQNEGDAYRAIASLAVIAAIIAVGMEREQRTTQNIFGLLGGTNLVPEIRNGKIRSQGAFQHSLTAGTFGATLIPLFVLLWTRGKAKVMALLGALGATAMTICSNGSTPLLAYVAGILAICCWPIRGKLRTLRVALVIGFLALTFLMKAPPWFIIAHIDLTGSSSGYHRAQIIDEFIKHLGDWFLIGTKDYVNWGWDVWDTQNEFVSVGETGGLIAFVLYIVVVSRSCARIGNARKMAKGQKREWVVWLLGAALFSNIVGFFGVNYFDQSKFTWFMLLAIISAVTGSILSTKQLKTEPATVEVKPETTHPAPEIESVSLSARWL